MNYYYEIKLNFNDVAYQFYEWDINDKLENIKKVPIVKIKSKVLKEIIASDFKVNNEFLEHINNKTICLGNSKIKNACIFCDTKNCIAIEFDDKGKSISRSFLKLEDENNICEISYSFKYYDLNIEKDKDLNIKKEFRQEEKIKKIISKEILELYNNKNFNKLEYLYYEWFDKTESDRKKVIKDMLLDLKNELKEEHYNIYRIIKMSYNKI